MNALDGWNAVSQGTFPLFYPDSFGRGLYQEGLFSNLQGLTAVIMGPSVFSARLPAAIAGTLLIPVVAMLAKWVFSSRAAAILAALVTAVSYWAIDMSRIGFSANLVPLALTFALVSLAWALDKPTKTRLSLSGVVWGLGLMTYASFRVAPVAALGVLVIAAWAWSWMIKDLIARFLAFIFGLVIGAAPFLWAVMVEPRIISERAADVSLLSADLNASEFLERILGNTSLALGKYVWLGDLNIRHNYSPYPILALGIGLLMFAGMAAMFVWMARVWMGGSLGVRENKTFVAFAAVWLTFLVMLVPEVLSADSTPHALRSIGTQPAAFLFVVGAMLALVRVIGSPMSRRASSTAVVVLSLIGISLVGDLGRYFILFSKSVEQHVGFEADLRAMTRFSAPQNGRTWIYLETPQQSAVVQYLNLTGADKIPAIESLAPVMSGDTVLVRIGDPARLDLTLEMFPESTVRATQLGSNAGEAFLSISIGD